MTGTVSLHPNEIQLAGWSTRGIRGGVGPTVVLIHSLGADCMLWDDVASSLAADFDVLAYDVRGQGASRSDDVASSVDLWCNDLRDLLDTQGIDSCALVGLSMGGMIAQAMAVMAPERVDALIVMGSACALDEEKRQAWRERVNVALNTGMEALLDPTIERWFPTEYRQYHPDEVRRVAAAVAGQDPRYYAAAGRVLSQIDLTHAIPAIAVPTLVVVGDRDEALPPPLSRQIHSLISGSKYLELKGIGHCAPVQAPTTTTEVISTFLTGQ